MMMRMMMMMICDHTPRNCYCVASWRV